METKYIDVSINLMKHPKFKWQGGMLTACGTRIKGNWMIKQWLMKQYIDDRPVPDLDDPATRGCLLAQVRVLCKDPDAYVCHFEEGWQVVMWPEPNVPVYSETEGLALANYILDTSRYI